ncbi:MAG TPA: hypothetical protein VGF45_08740 [Polyangia bacterium]
MKRDDQPSAEILAICRDVAWKLYKARVLDGAVVVARGLVVCDAGDWYHHALLAASLRKQRRFREALAQLDAGLSLLPGQPDLVGLRAEVFSASERLADVERKLALGMSPGLAAEDDAAAASATPGERRQRYLDMIRVVTDVLEAEERGEELREART